MDLNMDKSEELVPRNCELVSEMNELIESNSEYRIIEESQTSKDIEIVDPKIAEKDTCLLSTLPQSTKYSTNQNDSKSSTQPLEYARMSKELKKFKEENKQLKRKLQMSVYNSRISKNKMKENSV